MDGSRANAAAGFDQRAVEHEVVGPALDSWIVKPDKPALEDRGDITALGTIAVGA